MEQTIITSVVGLLTIAVNIGITLYNRGKNRNIYEIITMFSGQGSKIEEVNNLLKDGRYTILFVGKDFELEHRVRYILGRVK